jgi:hypothetical protein
MDARAEYMESTPGIRLAMASVLAVGIVVAWLIYAFAPLVMAPLAALPTLCEELAGYRALMQWFSLVLPVPGLWLVLYGSRILESGQSPPPGAWVLHRTLVKRGPHVTRVAVALAAVGLLVSLVPLYFWSDQSRHERTSIAEVCIEQ